MTRRFPRWAQPGSVVLWAIGLLLVWEAAAWLLADVLRTPSSASKLPYLHLVLQTMGEHLGTIAEQGAITFGNSIWGFLIGSAAGYGLAVLMSLSRTVEHTLSPYMVASQMIPVIGLAPILYGIVHNPEWSRILMSSYVTFFPVTINTLRGLRGVSPQQLELMRSYAAPLNLIYTKLKLKASLPGLFAGLKLSAPLAITASIIVELMGAPDGIGVLMLSSLYYGSAQVYMFWSTILASVLIGLLLYGLMTVLERWITPWQPEFRSQRGEEK